MKLKYFGEINPNELEDYYSTDIEVDGHTIQLDLNFTEISIDESRLIKVDAILENLPAFIGQLKTYIHEDYASGSEVQEYLDFHFDEVDEELAALLLKADQSLDKEEQLLSILKLERIGFYPEDDESFCVSDFEIDPEISQYLLVVNTTSDQELNYITMES